MPQSEQTPNETTSQAKGRSVHIGVNEVDPQHYSNWSGPLKLCENDMALMESIASDLGFKTETFATKDATREKVSAAIRSAAAELTSGDMFMITYAGHGGQVEDVNNDETDDFEDETWCLYNGQLLDDELALMWSEFDPGVRIVLISDSCNSGSIAKSIALPEDPEELEKVLATFPPPGLTDRAMPRDAARSTMRQIQRALPKPMPRIKATLWQISGCDDGQKSYDGKNNHGVFTEALTKTLDAGRFEGDYLAFFKAVHAAMPVWQKPVKLDVGRPNAEFNRQRPLVI
jgi:hypothetical protein